MSKFLDDYLKTFESLQEVDMSQPIHDEVIIFSQAEKVGMLREFSKKTDSIEEIAAQCRKVGFWNAEDMINMLHQRGQIVIPKKGHIKWVGQ